MSDRTYPCKGAGNEKCAYTVTYVRTPVLSVTRMQDFAAKNSAEKLDLKRVFLTCPVGHTNPYTLDASENIVG